MRLPSAATRPRRWPHFDSPVRSTALTARLGAALGIAIVVLFVTGLLSHYQYQPWRWLPEPASPVWGYRVTQGVHVLTGTACIPLTMIKLWSVYPNLFRWPPARTVRKALERLSIFVLVAATLVQLATGFMNVLNWYAFPWFFTKMHYRLAWVVIGAVLLHVAVKLPDIAYGLRARLRTADVLTEVPWEDNPDAHSNAGEVEPPTPEAIGRRGVLAAASVGIGVVVLTAAGQTVTALEPIGLLATRRYPDGPQRVPVNRTAEQADVRALATDPDWTLRVDGPRPFTVPLDALEDAGQLRISEARLPIACVEGWSVGALWRGPTLLDLVLRAGGAASSTVRLHSLEKVGYNVSEIFGPQLSAALLATHLNGARLDLDHGYPLRLISPNRAGVLNTKWLSRIEVL
ncbi:hypothetical protein FHX74_001557 [Friedmanniella endophytica]|uniref:Oxidoreductase molybdopterin-binding domain-containing protein n=1 Tax=Microlunatus kandeliicorticis TaxID=1759536 RepID=A0A7W3IRK7_9ACTN|nr:molybdopterin-dependent oxidoreductase [Microlunatus kandeliicorticis]MBA8793952.1 hypothetical protein [Microlunatus kandeliicorticis]